MSLGELPHLAAGHGPETVLLLADAELLPSLARHFRVLAPKQLPAGAEELEDFLRAQRADAPVHVVAEAAAVPSACWLAICSPERVQRLVLARPPCLSQDVLQRLGEIQAETLVVLQISAPPEAGQAIQQRIPRAYRFFVYSPARLPALLADFLLRGERFIVNTGETPSWSK